MENGTYRMENGDQETLGRSSTLHRPSSILRVPTLTGMVETHVGGMRWLIAAEYQNLLLGAEGLRLEEWLQSGQAVAVKHGPHRAVYRVELPGLSFYLKHNRVTDLRTWFGNSFGHQKRPWNLNALERWPSAASRRSHHLA